MEQNFQKINWFAKILKIQLALWIGLHSSKCASCSMWSITLRWIETKDVSISSPRIACQFLSRAPASAYYNAYENYYFLVLYKTMQCKGRFTRYSFGNLTLNNCFVLQIILLYFYQACHTGTLCKQQGLQTLTTVAIATIAFLLGCSVCANQMDESN